MVAKQLAVLDLAYPQVVHPSVEISVPMDQRACARVLRAAMQLRRESSELSRTVAPRDVARRALYVVCVPVQRGGANAGTEDTPYEWGCVARVVQLQPVPAGESCRLLVAGVARARVTARSVAEKHAVPIATVDVDVGGAAGASADSARLIAAAHNVIAALDSPTHVPLSNAPIARVPLLPPPMLERLRAMLKADDVRADELADRVMGALGGAAEWSARIEHLTLVDPHARVDRTAALLERAAERVRILRELLVAVPYALSDKGRTQLARAQLEAIVVQVADMSGLSLRVISQAPVGPAPPPRSLRTDRDAEDDDVAALAKRVAAAALPDEARRACDAELRRLKRMPPQGMERSVVITYLETMLDLPWDRCSADLDASEREALVPTSAAGAVDGPLLARARAVLAADHYGLDKIKKRILEYLAVLELKTAAAGGGDHARAYKGPILLLVGPPGTGKTSIARSLAAALQRPFVRLSLGGVRDEAEVRGHRRTYVGALPGSIVSALRRARASDCVMLLDEIDKLSSGSGVHGDPTAAMLEVLDPEQNHAFRDHYIHVPIDLSRVLFVATANTLDTIPEPLLDRVDVVPVSGYTYDEKVAIARRHIVPKQIDAQGLRPELLALDDDVLRAIATGYTREAGVRTLERRVGDVARAKAVAYAEAQGVVGVSADGARAPTYDPAVHVSDLEALLGLPPFDPDITDAVGAPGVATGLAYQGSGNGGILHIECVPLPLGKAELRLTGSLGDVIRESAELAFAWVRAHAYALGIVATRDAAAFPAHDVHLHMPAGATPKDGPSAGIAFVCALVSMYRRWPIDPRLAMTGEITLRGHVTPIGGVKEKVLGAHRAGVRTVVLPARNRREWDADVPADVRADLRVEFVGTIRDALRVVFGAELDSHMTRAEGWECTARL